MRGAAVSVLLFANVAVAQAPGAAGTPTGDAPAAVPVAEPQKDSGAKGAAKKEEPKAEPKPSRFRGSALVLDNSASTQTLGVGEDYQSSNPSYEGALSLSPRYLLWEQPKVRSVGVRGRIDLIHEFTDSDSSTERGEWTFSDTEIGLAYAQNLLDSDGYKTDLNLGIPNLSLPTSKVSSSNGKILSAGVSVALSQVIPLRKDEKFLPSAHGGVRVGYSYQFTRAVVPTNDGIERLRMDPDGDTLPSDQLSGATFSQHQGTIAVLAALDFTDVISLDTEFGWRPAYKYPLSDDVDICNVSTGCVTVTTSEDAPDFSVITLFHVGVTVDAPRPFGFSVGYDNVTLQLGPDGQRRNMLYSPDARFGGSVILHLDQVFDSGASAPPPTQTALRR
ncbi:MAG TPA: hypothetical protein VM686_30300 [Polyangiaceae bacterium]|nr:hypothetical protein [Polyangiaceae bacterium]